MTDQEHIDQFRKRLALEREQRAAGFQTRKEVLTQLTETLSESLSMESRVENRSLKLLRLKYSMITGVSMVLLVAIVALFLKTTAKRDSQFEIVKTDADAHNTQWQTRGPSPASLNHESSSAVTTDTEAVNYAVAVGINLWDQDPKLERLRGGVKDAERFASVVDENFEVVLMTDNSAQHLLPTRANVVRVLRDVVSKRPTNLLIFWAGHGRVQNGTAFLLPKDAVLTNSDITGLSIADLNALIAASKWTIPHKMLIVDACDVSAPKADDSLDRLLRRDSGAWLVLCSVSAGQMAREGRFTVKGIQTPESSEYHGAFTYLLLASTYKVPGDDGAIRVLGNRDDQSEVSWREAYLFARDHITELVPNRGQLPTPYIGSQADIVETSFSSGRSLTETNRESEYLVSTFLPRGEYPPNESGAFFTPGYGSVFAKRVLSKDPVRSYVLAIDYDISQTSSSVGAYLKFRGDNFDYTEWDGMALMVKGDAAAGYVKSLDVEVKIQGLGWRKGTISLDNEWRQKQLWFDDLKNVDTWNGASEIALVITPTAVGAKRGSISIDEVKFVKRAKRPVGPKD